MVLIKVTVLLAFSNTTLDGTEENIAEKETKSEKSNKKRLQFSKSSNQLDEDTPDFVIKIDKPIGVAHVEYELIPKKFKYQFDVICWTHMAKVCTQISSKLYKTVKRNDVTYAYITIDHRIAEISDEDLDSLKNHVIVFNITNKVSKTCLSQIDKSTKPRSYFVYNEDVQCDDFVEIFEQNPNEEENYTEKRKKLEIENFIQDILATCINAPTEKECTSRLHFGDPVHEFTVRDIIKRKISHEKLKYWTHEKCLEEEEYSWEVIKKEKEKLLNSPISILQKSKKEPKKKKSKPKSSKLTTVTKSKKSASIKLKMAKDKRHLSSNFTVPGAVLFTNPVCSIYRLNFPIHPITDGFVILSSQHLLRTQQKFQLNPLCLSLKKLKHVPVENWKSLGFEKIYVYCDIPEVYQIKTACKPIETCIRFNEGHVIFTKDICLQKLYETMQTGRIYVEIHGIRGPEQTRTGRLFQYEEEDATLSKRLRCREAILRSKENRKHKSVLLAVACYDISYLLKNSLKMEITEQCHHPDHTLYKKYRTPQMQQIFDYVTVNEMHFKNSFQTDGSKDIKESILLSHGTSFKIKISFMVPQFASRKLYQHLPDQSCPFKRIFVAVFHEPLARVILNEVILYNSQYSESGPNRYNKEHLEGDGEKLDLHHDSSAITGFMIDNRSDFLIYLEGPSDGFIMTVWHQLHNLTYPRASVFLNTEHVFTARLYGFFLTCEPFYVISMKIPLQSLFTNNRCFLKGNMPRSCYETAKKFHLLLNVSSAKEIFQYNLLPSAFELISFGLEFGVPHRFEA